MSERPKIYMYADAETIRGDEVAVVAIDTSGQVLAESSALDENVAQSECLDVLQRRGIAADTHTIMWVHAPEAHPGVLAAWKRARQAQHPDGDSDVETDRRPSPHFLRALQAEKHLCHSCAHNTMCLIAQSTRQLAGLYAAVSTCGGYEPPLPPELLRVAEELSNEGPEAPE